eukprot:sb/3478055/
MMHDQITPLRIRSPRGCTVVNHLIIPIWSVNCVEGDSRRVWQVGGSSTRYYSTVQKHITFFYIFCKRGLEHNNPRSDYPIEDQIIPPMIRPSNLVSDHPTHES